MNGQVYQLSRLVAYVRHFLKNGEIKDFPLLEYENLIFSFVPQRKLFSETSPYECHIVKNWLLELKKRHVKNIFLLINYSGNDPALAGFVNAEAQCMITIYENNSVTYWVPAWEYDKKGKHGQFITMNMKAKALLRTSQFSMILPWISKRF